MATFKEIRGQTIKKYTTNPTNPLEGQMWYNNTTGTLKVYKNIGGVWSSGGDLNTARSAVGGIGTQTTGLCVSGLLAHPTGTPGNVSTATEEYNGASWTTTGAVGTGRYTMGAAGTQTAALINKGYPSTSATTATELYDGSTWTSGTASNFYSASLGSGGTQTSAVTFGGSSAGPGGSATTDRTEEWDGSSWTLGGVLGTARYQMSGNNVGTQTASLAIGGYVGGAQTTVEEYNGSSWTAGIALPSGQGNASRYGLQTAAVIASGGSAPTTAALIYDGSAWTAVGSLATGRPQSGGCGSTTSGLVFSGGLSPTAGRDITEEFNDPTISIQTVTTS